MEQKSYQISGYRWVNLIVYTVVTFMAGMGFLAMAPLLDTMAERWTISFAAASLLMSVIGLFQLILSIPVGWAAAKVGFKLPVAIGASLLALGFLLRGTADSFGAFMLYTVIAGLGWGIRAAQGDAAAIWVAPTFRVRPCAATLPHHQRPARGAGSGHPRLHGPGARSAWSSRPTP